MTDLDALNKLSEDIATLREKYKPYSVADVNLKLYNALGVAQDQVEYAANILHRREPDPRQGSLLAGTPDGDVIITPSKFTVLADWCEICQNPQVTCTCPKENR